MLVPDSTSAPMVGMGAMSPSGDNERAERVPDNEALELAKVKAPLPEYAGRMLDVEA